MTEEVKQDGMGWLASAMDRANQCRDPHDRFEPYSVLMLAIELGAAERKIAELTQALAKTNEELRGAGSAGEPPQDPEWMCGETYRDYKCELDKGHDGPHLIPGGVSIGGTTPGMEFGGGGSASSPMPISVADAADRAREALLRVTTIVSRTSPPSPLEVVRITGGWMVNGERIAELSIDQLERVTRDGAEGMAALAMTPTGLRSAFAEALWGRSAHEVRVRERAERGRKAARLGMEF